MPELLSGAEMVQYLIHACQERVVRYHTRGFEAEQAGDGEAAERWYCLSRRENQSLQEYWRLGGASYLAGERRSSASAGAG